MSNFEENPKRPDSETAEQVEAPDPDRPVQGDATEYIEKGLKESEIETLEERDE